MLHIQVPLLHVGPDRFGGDLCNVQRKLGRDPPAASSNVCVTHNIVLLHCGGEWRRVFQRLGIAFVAIRVFVENSVTAPDRPLAAAGWIVGKADTRGWVE